MKRKHIETIVVICLFLALLARIYRSWNLVYIAAGVALASLCSKWFREKLYWAWMKLAEILGFISGRILLTIVFVLIVIPLSFFTRRKKKLDMKLEGGKDSYYTGRDHRYEKKDFERPW
jgi:hypothetical protein